ncbi:MAG: hypothetical protein NT120_02665 [Candidatus Aenigmarchaeota archaeon]|nr:hypothetical protein [Candidatus Aenigmarchaeota archaeon]
MKNVTEARKEELFRLKEFRLRDYYSNPQTYYAVGKAVLGISLIGNPPMEYSLLDCLGLYFCASGITEVILSYAKSFGNKKFNESIGNSPMEYSIPRLFLRSLRQHK